MSYRKLERITLWFLSIILIIMFIVSEWFSNSILELNESLLGSLNSTHQYYRGVIEDYIIQIEDLEAENVKLKIQIEEMEN